MTEEIKGILTDAAWVTRWNQAMTSLVAVLTEKEVTRLVDDIEESLGKAGYEIVKKAETAELAESLLTEPMEDKAIAEMKVIIKNEKKFLRFATNKMAAHSLSASHILDEKSYTLGIMDGKNYKDLEPKSDVAYKWRKIFASTNHNYGKITLSPEEAQELIDDIENSNK